MIAKREILDAASKLNLNPHVVEKDYALGWALAGIFAHNELAENWVFELPGQAQLSRAGLPHRWRNATHQARLFGIFRGPVCFENSELRTL